MPFCHSPHHVDFQLIAVMVFFVVSLRASGHCSSTRWYVCCVCFILVLFCVFEQAFVFTQGFLVHSYFIRFFCFIPCFAFLLRVPFLFCPFILSRFCCFPLKFLSFCFFFSLLIFLSYSSLLSHTMPDTSTETQTIAFERRLKSLPRAFYT